MPNLRVHFLPELVEPAELAGNRCVVIDVLRATTTMVSALAAGARAVVPCLTVKDARRLASAFPPDKVVLGGERGGLPIDGFDLGNSPAEYTPQVVSDKTVVLTTTNGTKALLHCQAASEIVIGAFVNLSAVCEYLTNSPDAAAMDVDVVCAGTKLQVTWDDVLLAGAVTERLAAGGILRLDDQAAIARDAWLAISNSAGGELKDSLSAALRESRGGRNLVRIGMQSDIELAAAIDAHLVLPHFDPETGRVVLADSHSNPADPN
jgi:2-phosphosulfolactate phosphatase